MNKKYPALLKDVKFPLKITIDSCSLEDGLQKGNPKAELLLKYKKTPGLNFLRTPFRPKNKLLKNIQAFVFNKDEKGNISSLCYKGEDEANEKYQCEVAWGYMEPDVKKLIEYVCKKSPADKSDDLSLRGIFAHSCLERDIYVTNNRTAITSRLWLQRRVDTIIMSIGEAMQFIDLLFKYANVYYLAPRYKANRGLWYLLSFKSKVPSYQLAWSYSVFGRGQVPHGREMQAILSSFSSRATDALRAVDEIGFEYYTGVNNDTLDGMIYHLSYLIVLITGLFDSLAWLTLWRYNLPIPKGNQTLVKLRVPQAKRVTEFNKSVKDMNPKLTNFLVSKKNKTLVNLFYPLRDSIQHRTTLDGLRFRYDSVEVDWDHNLIRVEPEVAQLLSLIDSHAEEDLFSRWGAYSSHGETFIEPYTFSKQACQSVFNFCNSYLKLLDFKSVVAERPDIEKRIDASRDSESWKDFKRTLEIFNRNALGG